jgi:endonuclease III related protein
LSVAISPSPFVLSISSFLVPYSSRKRGWGRRSGLLSSVLIPSPSRGKGQTYFTANLRLRLNAIDEVMESPIEATKKPDLAHTLKRVYETLFSAYGPQHWWPGETPFEVIIGAILTQNTTWKNVERAIANLKDRGLLSVEGLRDVPVDDLALLIRPAGYFNSKARKLKMFVNFLCEKHDCRLEKLFALDAEEMRAELLGVWGIGEETADSIVLYAAEKPSFVTDAYTRRLFSRLGVCDETVKYGALRHLFMSNLAPDTEVFNEYHALIVHHSKYFCSKRHPRCTKCPLIKFCSGNVGVIILE